MTTPQQTSGAPADATGPPRLTRKGQATRDRIVSTAAALMHEHGVAGTSTEDVQSAAGVNPSQLYYYFKDKRALVRAVIAYQTENVVGRQEQVLTRMDSMEALRGWRDFAVRMQNELGFIGGCPVGSLAGELSDSDPQARADVAAAFARWGEAFRTGLRCMQERGELRTGPGVDVDRLSLALLTALQGGLLLSQIRRDTVALEAALDTAIDQIQSLTVR
jgi:AcrR family transcriptional regulator